MRNPVHNSFPDKVYDTKKFFMKTIEVFARNFFIKIESISHHTWFILSFFNLSWTGDIHKYPKNLSRNVTQNFSEQVNDNTAVRIKSQ